MKKQIPPFLLAAAMIMAIVWIMTACRKEESPEVETHPVEEITATTVLAGGTILDTGSDPITSKGICYSSTNSQPTLSNRSRQYDGTANDFKVLVDGLEDATNYYLRAYARNAVGIAYGETISFSTIPGLPLVETKDVEEISYHSALGGGIIHDQGNEPVTDRGICWSRNNPFPNQDDYCLVDDGSDEKWQSLMEDLQAETQYHVRAYATNLGDTAFGQPVSFTTLRGLPKVETNQVEDITYHSAVVGGTVIYPGGEPITSQGVCWSQTNPDPGFDDNCLEDTSGDDNFSFLLEDLSSGSEYFVRAYASNLLGDDFGQTVSFSAEYKTVSDIDGNEYRIKEIGNQTWMIDNLRTTRFSNGDPIPLREENQYWAAETALDEPAYCWYNNDESYADPYGALYNFEAAADPRNVCPDGWRVMTNDDLRELIMDYLGGSAGGGALKTTGTIEQGTGLWYAPNTAATNESGFSAIPAGFRNVITGEMGYHSLMWTSESAGNSAIALGLAYNDFQAVPYYFPKHNGKSVRCIKE